MPASRIRPALRPGAAILRRDAFHLQIGSSPGVVVADRPGLWAYLLLLDGTCAADQVAAKVPELANPAQTLSELLSLGAVVDAATWDTRHLDESRAYACRTPPPALTRRREARLDFYDDAGSRAVSQATKKLLRQAGLRYLADSNPDLTVLIVSGEPSRRLVNGLIGQPTDHLIVRLDETRAVIGPLSIAGIGPCLQCHDLAKMDLDSAWAALIPQFGHRAPHHNKPALSALTIHAAVSAIAEAVLAYVEDPTRAHPHLVVIGPHHHQRTWQPLRAHPTCSCSLLPVTRSA